MNPRKSKSKQEINWSFRLLVVLMVLGTLGWTGYRYGVKPYRVRQGEVIKARMETLAKEYEEEINKLRTDQEDEIADLELKLKVLDLEHKNYLDQLQQLDHPTPTPTLVPEGL